MTKSDELLHKLLRELVKLAQTEGSAQTEARWNAIEAADDLAHQLAESRDVPRVHRSLPRDAVTFWAVADEVE